MDKRATPPTVKKLIRPELPDFNAIHLDNGIVVHELRAGTQPLIKLEIQFRAGRPFEHKKQAARFTNHLIREGSMNLNAGEIAEFFDFYGSAMLVSETLDHSGFTLFCLKKHFRNLLPVFLQTMMQPAFKDVEIDRFRKNAVEKLNHDLSKNDFLAYREITSLIFGPESYYGYNSTEKVLNDIRREDLQKHFSRCYVGKNADVYISGRTDDQLMQFLVRELAVIPAGDFIHPSGLPSKSVTPGRYYASSKNKHQIAIRIAKPLFNRTHADFNKMYVTNTLLGGFFGSRLMSNLREEQGYTYNVYSSIDAMLFDGAYLISLETDPGYVEESIQQIHKELLRLCEEPVSNEELQLVKNYLSGYLLNALDGPLNASELYKGFIQEGLSPQDFSLLVDTILYIDSKEIIEIAQRYLQPDSFIELLVGLDSKE